MIYSKPYLTHRSLNTIYAYCCQLHLRSIHLRWPTSIRTRNSGASRYLRPIKLVHGIHLKVMEKLNTKYMLLSHSKTDTQSVWHSPPHIVNDTTLINRAEFLLISLCIRRGVIGFNIPLPFLVNFLSSFFHAAWELGGTQKTYRNIFGCWHNFPADLKISCDSRSQDSEDYGTLVMTVVTVVTAVIG